MMKGKFLTLIGTALTLALSSTVTVAQSTKFPSRDFPEREEPTKFAESDDNLVAAAEEKLSPDAMEILCVRFPLNSRCSGANAATPSPEESTTEESMPAKIALPQITVLRLHQTHLFQVPLLKEK